MIAEAVRALITGACAVLGISMGSTALEGADHFALQAGGFIAGSLVGHGISHVVHLAWKRARPIPTLTERGDLP